MSRMGRPTNDPKSLRLELRISEKEKEMLEFCIGVYKVSKGEIFRLGLKKMYDAAGYEKKLQQEREDWEILLTSADQIRINQIRDDVYGAAYKESYIEKYSELILNPKYKWRNEVVADAIAYAEKTAESIVERAINEFLGIAENIKKG